jgi:putative oxidoreductase
MFSVLGRFSGPLYGMMRIVFGVLWAFHGAQKLFGAFGGRAQPLASLMGVAGTVELFGGLLIALGLFTPIVAFIGAGQMAVAYFRSHAPQGVWPIENRGELAALYCFAFLYISARGAGALSLDALLTRGRSMGVIRS